MKPRVAFISTGGTIAARGANGLDLIDYGSPQTMLEAEEVLACCPEIAQVADVLPVRFKTISSYEMGFREWKELVELCAHTCAEHRDLAGIVIGSGTSCLEELAYFLNLTLDIGVPVVVVGSQRPFTAISSDAGRNLFNAVRTAIVPQARGMGVLVVMNDEIHAARDVTKASTVRLNAFQSPDFGILGYADLDHVLFYRRPVRRCAPETEFNVRSLARLPKVDIHYSHADSDGTAVRALIAAGAEGIVSAGFAPGHPGIAEAAVLAEATANGVVVVLSSRCFTGRVFPHRTTRDLGFLRGDNLSPQKARLLLALALTITRDRKEIERMLATY